MRFPLTLTTTMIGYIAKKKFAGVRKFPLVLMLEPLHACNLTCTGCGRIREYEESIKEKLSVQQCLDAAEECGAPIVSLCGGEPMIYPEIGTLVHELLKRRKHIYLCTNGMFIKKKLHEFRPTSRFFFNVHLDGLRETHDLAVERDGVFDAAVEGIKAAKQAGFLVDTQQPDGNWHEDEFTGTGFPRVFYLKYHLYRLYFPLMALARYQGARNASEGHGFPRARVGLTGGSRSPACVSPSA